MQSSLNRYILLAKRWLWIIVLGVVVCGGMTYIASKITRPTYQASTQLVLAISTSQSPYENASAALELLPTYARLVANPQVLQPVATKYKLTVKQLTEMITVKPQSNTQIIEIYVESSNPVVATSIANDVAQNFAQYSRNGLNGMAQIQILPALEPTTPLRPRPLQDASIGSLVGLGLALALIVAFEWIDDRLTNPEEIRKLTGQDALAVLPELSRKQGGCNIKDNPVLAESYRILSAHTSIMQTNHPFKLLMVTSAVAGEGKSTLATNLATFLALSDKRVLLVDADLRRSVLDQHFQLDNHHGLADTLLTPWEQIKTALEGQLTEVPALRVLTSGAYSSNPAELLQSPLAQELFNKHFREMDQFDYIIFDTPPLLPVADAQIMASYMDATLLVIDATIASRKQILQAVNILRKSGTNLIGTALNKSQWPEYNHVQEYLATLHAQRTKKVDIVPVTPAYQPIADEQIPDDTLSLKQLP
ncbi:MAG: polysaccharide biosynthesis tyrosine autokinase [Chloroflexi bacterium]|nr:MAG: polysaccharide biosynthesis tyrosine autokinase [Chloroflexota bacterium]